MLVRLFYLGDSLCLGARLESNCLTNHWSNWLHTILSGALPLNFELYEHLGCDFFHIYYASLLLFPFFASSTSAKLG